MSAKHKRAETGDQAASSAPGVVNELLMAGLELSQVLERELRERVGLSLNQFNVLRVIAGRESGIAHAVDLIRVLGMSSAHATTVLHQLEDRKLIERRENTADRRRRVISLTAEGHDLLLTVLPVLADLEDRMAAVLGEPPQRTQLRHQLRQVRLALRHGATAKDWDDCVGP